MRTERRWQFIVGMFLLVALYITADRVYPQVRATPALAPEDALAVVSEEMSGEMSAKDLATYAVVSADGTQVGPVESVIVDSSSAATHYVIVRLKDIYAFGKGGGAPQDRFLVIPWSHVRLNPAHHEILLDVDGMSVASAPTLDDLPNTVTPTWDREIRQYWLEQ